MPVLQSVPLYAVDLGEAKMPMHPGKMLTNIIAAQYTKLYMSNVIFIRFFLIVIFINFRFLVRCTCTFICGQFLVDKYTTSNYNNSNNNNAYGNSGPC